MSLPTSSPRPPRQARLWGAFVGLALCLSATRPALGQALPPDPVQRFRDALTEDRLIPSTTVTEEEKKAKATLLAYRKANLMARAGDLKSIRDLARVLPLREWRYEERDAELADIDLGVFKKVTEQFMAEFKAQVARDQPAGLVALSVVVGELSNQLTVPAQGNQVRIFLRDEVAPALGKLTDHPNSGVKTAAAKALGKVFTAVVVAPEGGMMQDPLAKLVTPVASLLDAKDEAVRLGGIEALSAMVPGFNVAEQKQPFLATIPNEKLRRTLGLLLPPLFKGLADSNPGIRRTSAETIRRISDVLATTLLFKEDTKDRYPPRGRTNLTPDEKKRIADDLAAFKAEVAAFDRTLKIFHDKTSVIAAAIKDSDPTVRRQAMLILEDLAEGRRRNRQILSMILRTDELPIEQEGEEQEPQESQLPPSVAARSLKKLLPNIIEALDSPDVQLRLYALGTIEVMGTLAASAGPAVVKRLQDREMFVRWAAARALGKIGPPPAGAVEGLAKLLGETDLSPRIAAAVALERYGPAAAAAVPTLTKMVNQGDGDSRVQMMHTLLAIGKAAEPAIPAIASNLTDGDARVRRLAAFALGRFGRAASSAAAALLKAALTDEDADVRANAAEALLSVPAR